MRLEEFKRLADLLPEPLVVVGLDGAIHAANRSAESALAFDGHGLVGRSLLEGATNGQQLTELIRASSRTRSFLPGSMTHDVHGRRATFLVEGALFRARADEQPALVLLRITPKGVHVRRFLELNERVEALVREIARRRLVEKELEEQREWLQTTLVSIGDAVIATTPGGEVSFLNPVAEQLTGWTEVDAIGRPLAEVFRIVNEQTREPAENPVAHVIREGVVVGLANHTVLLARDGREVAIDDSAAPIRGDDGSIVGIVMIFHDVSDRRHLERELRAQMIRLAEADRRKDEFLAMLAHELRNPLAPILNSIHILRARNLPVSGQILDIAERQVNHLRRLVDDLLDVARITRGMIHVAKNKVDLREVVASALETTDATLRSRSHDVTVAIPSQPVFVAGDRVRLEQVFVNLLNNAAKFTDPNGNIHVEVRAEDGWSSVAVRDNGAGIQESLLTHIFDLFVQSPTSLARSSGGLGIGLTLVRRIVEMHDGFVRAHSGGLGTGSEFIVAIPVQDWASIDVEHADAPVTRADGRRILVVDDNEDAAITLADSLRLLEHDVWVAHSGRDAISVARETNPDVILLDIGLPDLNGYEVVRVLRSDPLVARALIFAVSGYGRDEDRERSKQAGLDAHFVKPVDPRELHDAIADGCAKGS